MNTDKDIHELFARHEVPLDRDDVWQVQSARVVRHKALERLAAKLGISFASPTIVRAERDEAVVLVHGTLPGRIPDCAKPLETQEQDAKAKTEWSFGEALVNTNYRVVGKMAAYVWAMAEKRAKDRVILKLAGLHGVYSEDEADDFKPPRDEQAATAPQTFSHRRGAETRDMSADEAGAELKARLDQRQPQQRMNGDAKKSAAWGDTDEAIAIREEIDARVSEDEVAAFMNDDRTRRVLEKMFPLDADGIRAYARQRFQFLRNKAVPVS